MDEPAGENCATGGVRVEVGPDDDGDGAPDSVTSTSYACNGSDGVDGVDGMNGMNGMNGMDGADAVSHLTLTTPEPAGVNCPDGGVRIDSGADADASGSLESAEIATTQYVCNGSDAAPTLMALTPEPAGTNCAAAGVRIDTGPDADASGVLDPAEVTATRYVCNGADGMDGDPVAAFGSAPMVNVFNEGPTTLGAGAAGTLQTASITVPRAGLILAIGTVDAFCRTSGAPTCASPPHDGYLSITTTSADSPAAGDRSYYYLTPDATENFTRTDVFSVSAGGTFTYYLRALNANTGSTGYYRSAMTLVFVPTA